MWPWEHLAVGYLCYSLLLHLGFGRSPRNGPTIALVVGTQFPDLVDKPLAWTFGILPNGRSLAHSLLTALVLLALVRFVFYRYRRPWLANAFGIGYLTHLAGDALYPLLAGDLYYLSFLAWPLAPAIEYGEKSFAAHLPSFELSMFSMAELGLMVLLVGLWLLDGMPGLTPVVQMPRRAYRQLSTYL